MRKIGGHVSASGGLDKAVDRAADIGANCLQLFSGSPRVWARKSLSEINTEKLFSKQQNLSVSPIITHSLYLINLASDNEALVEKSINALIYDMKFDAQIQGAGIVVHVGSHTGRGWEEVNQKVVERIGQIIDQSPQEATFLIENSAGQGGKLHSDLEDIRWTFDQLPEMVEQGRLGWCFDTCHGFANGYQLGDSTPSISDKSKHESKGLASDKISELNLWSTLKCIHVNDSKDPFGSGRDRHENIGDGQIPLEDLQYFLNLDQVTAIPLITEVPGIDGKGPDQENIERIKKLVGET